MRSAAVCLVVFAVACGSSQKASAPPATPPHAAAATSPNDMPPPAGTLRRSEVRDALSAGLGAFLQYVTFDVDHPVFREPGKTFVGFRILELKGPRWAGIDLKPGDVVTAVNGFPIEHPEQAQQAFMSLAVASELRVDYLRDGQPRSIRLAILDN
jgi:type II secretory pathway component PulC